jgi:hypothetical protein
MVWPAIFLAAAAALLRTASGAIPDAAKRQETEPPRYDAATYTRISGTIIEVRDIGAPSVLRGIFLVVRVEKRNVEVYLCPAEFLKRFDLKLNAGDDFQASGSKVRFAGADLLLARDMRRHNDILTLRDEDGAPYWEDEP